MKRIPPLASLLTGAKPQRKPEGIDEAAIKARFEALIRQQDEIVH